MKAMAADYFAQMPRSFLYFGYTTVIDVAVDKRDFINREHGFGAQRNPPVMSRAVFAQVRRLASRENLVLVTHGNSFGAQT